MLNKWVADEAGKVANLSTIWSYTEDCLMQETQRVGLPIIFGTSGEIGTVGKGLKEMWDNNEIYKLKRFFFAGWMGLIVDSLGNDLREEGIRWIIYKRYLYQKLGSKAYNEFLQKYPLNVNEAFSQSSEGGVGDILKINAQMRSLSDNPAKGARGRFRVSPTNVIEWVPTHTGEGILYERPDNSISGLFVAGADPVDHDDAFDTDSDLSLYILKKQHGTDPPRIVFEYTARPNKAAEFYDQALLALQYYNNCKALIEKNRFRMVAYFEENGFKYLIKTAPAGLTRLLGGRTNSLGMTMNANTKEYMAGLIDDYVFNYCEWIPSMELLQEFVEWGSKNTDRAIAFGWALIHLKDDKRIPSNRSETEGRTVPTFTFRNINGKIVRVHENDPKPERARFL
jgi:hypothetical protein